MPATLLDVDTTPSTTQLVGWVVRTYIGRRPRYTLARAADDAGVTLSTLNRILAGKHKTNVNTLLAVEAAVGIPTPLLSLVLDGDVERIRRMTSVPDDLKEYIVSELEGFARGGRRATDRSA